MADADSRWTSPKTILAIIGIGLTGAGVAVAYVNGRDAGGDDSPAVRVTEVDLTAPVQHFGVRCPHTFSYEGAITVETGVGRVGYRFLFRDGISAHETSGPVKSVAVDGPQTVPVRYEWTATIPRGAVSRTVTLEVITPTNMRSRPVTVSGTCDDRYPEGPPVPPPDVGPPSG